MRYGLIVKHYGRVLLIVFTIIYGIAGGGANRKALWWQFKTMSSGQQVLILFDAIFVIQFSVIRKQSS